MLLLDDPDDVSVNSEGGVVREEDEGLRETLRHQHAIERIFMDRWEAREPLGVGAANRKLDETHPVQGGAQQREVHPEIGSA